MITLIISIFAVYFAWLVIKPWLAWYARRKFEQKVSDMFGFRPAGGGEQQTARAQQTHSPRRRGKKIGRDVGEYVEFEELEGRMAPPVQTDSGYTPRESRISDAEWEDIY